MTEEQKRGLEVWRKIHGDPDLLDGVTIGDFSDLSDAVAATLASQDVIRTIPIGLAIRIGNVDAADFATQLDTIRELIRFEPVAAALRTAAFGSEE